MVPAENGGKPRQLPRDSEEWIEVPVPVIIDETSWQAAQKQLEANKSEIAGRPQNTTICLTSAYAARSAAIRCGLVQDE